MVDVLIEVDATVDEAFTMHRSSNVSNENAQETARQILGQYDIPEVEIEDNYAPVPMFSESRLKKRQRAFSSTTEAKDFQSKSIIVSANLPPEQIDELKSRTGIAVWPNSELTLYNYDNANSRGGVDCQPFRRPVEIADIRQMLNVNELHRRGFRGQNTVVGIIDEGIDGTVYPVTGGFSRTGAQAPGTAPIDSHGSMCAADVLVAAPAARLYDYPFLGIPNSGGALQMFQAALDQRRLDGTPHILNNSYGFIGVPDAVQFPDHEVNDLNHPLHRKIREVVAAGVSVFFAAGNCGADCPSGNCHNSGIGPGQSIHASNSLSEVITVGASNSRNERIGYSSQGPGMFETEKPDVMAYSHFHGNFGPDRPAGGGANSYDNGTSAAAPVAAGVGAVLLSAFPSISPSLMKDSLTMSAHSLGNTVSFDYDHGYGVINANGAFEYISSFSSLFV